MLKETWKRVKDRLGRNEPMAPTAEIAVLGGEMASAFGGIYIVATELLAHVPLTVAILTDNQTLIEQYRPIAQELVALPFKLMGVADKANELGLHATVFVAGVAMLGLAVSGLSRQSSRLAEAYRKK